MKLVCPKCVSEIPAANANLAEGICSCPRCGEFFKIASLVGNDAAVVRVPKPEGSLVELIRTKDGLGIMIPRSRSRAPAIGLGLFALFWNTIAWTGFLGALTQPKHDFIAVPFVSIFVLVGLGLVFLALFVAFAEFTLVVDRDECQAVWTILKWKYTRRIPRAAITAVGEDVVYTKNHRPVYGIALRHGTKTLKFGSDLSEAERAWLISELQMYLDSARLVPGRA